MIDGRALRGRRPWRARIVLAIVLVGFLALATRVAVTLVEPDLLEQKLAGAQRYIYYRMRADKGPTFQLEADSTALRLVTHVVVPPNQPYDPSRELEYGVRVHVDLDSGKVWEREIYTRSRQSKGRRTEGAHAMWLDENTFIPEAAIELTDDRLLAFTLPSPLPTHATAHVTLLGDMQEGYVRAYSPVPRDNVARRLRELTDRDRSRIAAQTSYVPWDRLNEPEDLAELRYAERRLSAEGKDGIDYQTKTLFTTGFRLRTSTTIERGLLITAMRGTAINVVGPAKIDLVITRPAAFTAEPGKLDVALVGEPLAPGIAGPSDQPASSGSGAGGSAGSASASGSGSASGSAAGAPPVSIDFAPPGAVSFVAIDLPTAGATATRTIDVPAGVFTLTLVASATARLELSAAATTAVVLGAPAGAPLVPDEQATSAYVSDPAAPPIKVVIDGPPDLLSRVLRIDVRALASAPISDTSSAAIASIPGGTVTPIATAAPSMDPVAAIVAIDTLDEHGAVIANTMATFESVPSRFEIAKLAGKLAASVCEPASIRFVVPPGGHSVLIRTDKPALVQVQTPLAISPPPDRLDTPYDAIGLVTMRWRYARFLERGWLALRPQNHDALAPAHVATLVAQARLEPREITPAPDVRGSALAPDGAGERQTVIERVAPEDVAGFLADWDVGRYTKILPNQRVELDLARLPSRPSIRYRTLDDGSVGAAVTIEIDDAPVDDTHFNAARGSLRLPSGLSGRHAVTIKTDAKVELLIDRPPVKRSAELYALRTVYAIGGARRVRLKIKKPSAAKQNINILIYTPNRGGDANVRITVDGGSPPRVSGVALAQWSLADRTVPLVAADRPPTLGFADTSGGKLYPRRLAVSLGDDLPAGTHTIELSVAGGDVWGRFFTLDDAPVAPRALQWRESAEESP